VNRLTRDFLFDLENGDQYTFAACSPT